MTVLGQAQPPEVAPGADSGQTVDQDETATTVPARPTTWNMQRRRNTSGIRRTDVLAILGALAAAATTTGILWTQLGPFTGILGYVVVTWLLIVGYYAVLVSFDENRMVVRDRIATLVVHSLGLVLLTALVSVIVYTTVRGWRP